MQNGYQNCGVNQLARRWIGHLVFHMRYASKTEDASHQDSPTNLFETNYESYLGPQAELNRPSLLGTCENGTALSCMKRYNLQFSQNQNPPSCDPCNSINSLKFTKNSSDYVPTCSLSRDLGLWRCVYLKFEIATHPSANRVPLLPRVYHRPHESSPFLEYHSYFHGAMAPWLLDLGFHRFFPIPSGKLT